MFETLLAGDTEPEPARGNRSSLPACVYLDDAITTARRHGDAIAGLADSIAEIAGQVTWVRRDEPDRATPGFARGHANAILVRSRGREWQALMGVSLMAPHVTYPDHQHLPEEVYIVLSPGEWRNDRVDWFEPGVGNVVHNPPEIVHAMRSGDSPLLAVWLHVDRCVSPDGADG